MNSTDRNKGIEQLRLSYKPATIKILFVGESAPVGVDFFYKGTGQVFRAFESILAPHIGISRPFLSAFKGFGLYLDDLVLEPINHRTAKERRSMHLDNVEMLAVRIAAYRPMMVVSFLKAIADPVAASVHKSGVACLLHAVSFPGNGRQGDFKREMTELLPEILKV